MNSTLSFYDWRVSGEDTMRDTMRDTQTLPYVKELVWTFCTHRQRVHKNFGSEHLHPRGTIVELSQHLIWIVASANPERQQLHRFRVAGNIAENHWKNTGSVQLHFTWWSKGGFFKSQMKASNFFYTGEPDLFLVKLSPIHLWN